MDKEYAIDIPEGIKVIEANKLTDLSDEEIIAVAIKCEESGKAFRIIKSELAFYRKHNISLPKKHPDIRHKDRMTQRNPRKLREKNCDQCGIDMQTSYAPERKEKIYCEECYKKEIY